MLIWSPTIRIITLSRSAIVRGDNIAEESHLPVIEAREILDRIENGDPVIFDHVAIVGDIDISELDLPLVHCERPSGQTQTASVVSSRIRIRNCEFHGKVSFAQARFQEPLDLCGSIFGQEVRFKGASFHGGARFEAAGFKRYATFRDAKFAHEARFQGASFSAIANFGNAVFDCPANFGSASFCELCTNFGETTFREDADFTGTRFSGTANFKLATFDRAASFWKAAFLNDANFQGAKFAGYASFQSAVLSGNADFRGASFGEELNMEFARFQGNVVFLGSSISGNANFFRVQLNNVNFIDAVLKGDVQFREAVFGESSFMGSHFQGDANFSRARFQGVVIFEEAIFGGAAQFLDAVFSMDSDFRHVRFCGDTSFSSSEFLARAHFDSADFQEDASFQGTQFMDTAYFTGAIFRRNLTLANAKIQVMRLSDASFAGQISLHNAEFIRLEARWPNLCDHLIYDGAAYLALTKNFKNLEWFEDADDCYYHYRRMSQSGKSIIIRADGETKINWSKILDSLAWISCGYGVRPRYTIFLSCFLILLFAFLFWQGKGIVVEPLNGSGTSLGGQENLTFLDNLYFSAMVFTAKTQVKWYPVSTYRYIATIESVSGWLLLALFLVTLGRTMIR